MSLVVVTSERFAEHQTPPGHPESPQRASVLNIVASEWRRRDGAVVLPTPASREALLRVHDGAYLALLDDYTGRAAALDADTFTSPESIGVAKLAAGAAVAAVDEVLSGRHDRGLVLVRPPGHHAERNRAMGFCFYNNIAVAAAHARARGVKRLAVMDYDVHHGNGTQHMFADDPSVLYISTHQFPYYPGSGAADEVGVGAGAGFTVNAPLEAGATDDDYRIVFQEVVLPVLGQFEPEMILVSAGFDAHELDPLAGMRLTTPAFAAMTADLRRVASVFGRGRIVAVTEGGYHLEALGKSLLGVLDVLGEPTLPVAHWPSSSIDSRRGRATVDAVCRAQAGFWKLTG